MKAKNSVYDFSDYKDFLRFKVGDKSARRGLKSALAQALGCQPTYISQVLNDHAHLSTEQGMSLNLFFGHTKEESHFFLLLLQKERAGTQVLKKYYQEQMQDVLDRRLSLTKRLGTQNILSEEDKTTFYSSWHFTAIHIALTIPELQTKEALANYFRLSLKKVGSVLEFLISAGLVVEEGGRFKAGSTLIRIGNDSPHILKHHSNWRTQALESLDREELSDLHYSAVVSLSADDVRELKNHILESIKDYLSLIRESKEEEVYALCIDFFGAKKS